MINIAISQVEPGMVLAAPIRHPEVPGHILLKGDFSLGREEIARLKTLDISSLWIRHPGFDYLDQELGDAIPESRSRLYSAVKTSFTGIANKTAGAFDILEYRTIIGETIMAMVGHEKNAVWAERIMDGGSELFTHSSNVAYLSLVIGMRLKNYIFQQRKFVSLADGTDLTNLGIGALLHDIGKLALDAEMQGVHCLEKRAQTEEYRGHSERGYRAVQGRIEATSASIVLHHHQQFDGKGFPKVGGGRGGEEPALLAGRSIHIFGRIVAVANVLDGMLGACRRNKQPTVVALEAIRRAPCAAMFDPVVLDAALRVIPPFPVGSCVELSDGRQAVVTDLQESSPCHPTVCVLAPRSDGGAVTVDLSARGAPSITKIGGLDVRTAGYTLAERALSHGGAAVPA